MSDSASHIAKWQKRTAEPILVLPLVRSGDGREILFQQKHLTDIDVGFDLTPIERDAHGQRSTAAVWQKAIFYPK
jgi:hypothetical protein